MSARINPLENLVKYLSDKQHGASGNNINCKIDCIPEFEPGILNVPVSMWFGYKIFAMLNRLRGLAKICFDTIIYHPG